MKKKLFIIGGIIIFLFPVVFFAMFFLPKLITSGYTIPNVPYIGIYNHTGEYKYFNGDTGAAVASVLEYWNPGKNDPIKINNGLIQTDSKKVNNNQTVADFINTNFSDFTAELKKLSFADVKKYISAKQKTPLLIQLSLQKDRSKESPYYPYSVLIGIDSKREKLIFHNYWFGNNYEVSFKLFDFTQSGEAINFVVIKPKNFEAKIKEISARKVEIYPARTQLMEDLQEMLVDYTAGFYALGNSEKTAGYYFLKIVNNSKFQDRMPPYYKVLVYDSLAEYYLKQGDYKNASTYAVKALSENQNLDKPYLDWPGYEVSTNRSDIADRISEPFRILGDIEKANNNKEAAKSNYNQALYINPKNSAAQEGLKSLE